jgi:hypothetical protein
MKIILVSIVVILSYCLLAYSGVNNIIGLNALAGYLLCVFSFILGKIIHE